MRYTDIFFHSDFKRWYFEKRVATLINKSISNFFYLFFILGVFSLIFSSILPFIYIFIYIIFCVNNIQSIRLKYVSIEDFYNYRIDLEKKLLLSNIDPEDFCNIRKDLMVIENKLIEIHSLPIENFKKDVELNLEDLLEVSEYTRLM